MKSRSIVGGAAASLLVVAGIVACADSEEAASSAGPGNVLPGPDATTGTGSDGGSNVDGDAGCSGSGCATPWPFTSSVLPIDARYNLFAVWGSAANDVWAAGTAGTIVHFDGSAWSAAASPTVEALNAIWGASADDVWAVSSAGTILRRHGGATPAWAKAPAVDGNNPWRALAVRGFGAEHVLVVGSGITGDPDMGNLASVMGSGRLLADAGVAWAETPGCITCTDLHGLWGTGASDVWVVGESGTAQHASAFDDGGAPVWVGTQTATTRTLTAVWGSAASDVWAVGSGGTVVHWTNAPSKRWDVVPSGTDADLTAIWGSGPNDVWAVGENATVIHFDGTSWSRRVAQIPAPSDGAPLSGVWGSGPDDVWIVGRGVVLHSGKGGM